MSPPPPPPWLGLGTKVALQAEVVDHHVHHKRCGCKDAQWPEGAGGGAGALRHAWREGRGGREQAAKPKQSNNNGEGVTVPS